MISRKTRSTEKRYRKMPEPLRVVPLSNLEVTESVSRSENNSPLVSHSGTLDTGQSWHPMRRLPTATAISSNSWTGLHRRLLSSKTAKVEAS